MIESRIQIAEIYIFCNMPLDDVIITSIHTYIMNYTQLFSIAYVLTTNKYPMS